MKRTIPILTVLLALVATACLADGRTMRLTILHTNDTHGHLQPFSYPEISPPGSEIQDLPARRDIGGIARRATIASRVRAELAREGTTVWMIDSGDFSDGSAFSTEYHGEADLVAMNRVGYNLGTFGNHEFNTSLAETRKLLALARYPILIANATDRATGAPLARRDTILTVGDVRIGVFGLVTSSAGGYPAAREGVTIADEVETARSMVERLRGAGKADLVLLISHCGEQGDERIAREVPGIDVIVGGHSHSRLPIGELIWRSDELKGDQVNGTIIVQAFQWGGELGRLDLLLEKSPSGVWGVERYREQLIPITKEIPEDPAVAAVVDSFWKPIAARYGEVIGTATADFSDRGDDMAEYNLVADAVRATFGVDADFENLGGVRAPILEGPITRAELAELDPFQNTVVTFSIKGSALRSLLLRSAPAVSGIRYRIFGGKLEEATIGGAPLDDGRVYRCATNSYYAPRIATGPDVSDVKDTGKPRFDVILEYIRKAGTVTPSYDGRRIVIGR